MAWLDQNVADNLLGNARPKTYDLCRQDGWWFSLFYRWWQEGANGKPMYEAVYSLYEDLMSYYNGQMGVQELHEQWVNDPPNTTLIDAGARAEFARVFAQGEDVTAAVGRLWEATAAQMETIYGVFYEDVGRAKDTIRAEGVQRALEECFPSL